MSQCVVGTLDMLNDPPLCSLVPVKACKHCHYMSYPVLKDQVGDILYLSFCQLIVACVAKA